MESDIILTLVLGAMIGFAIGTHVAGSSSSSSSSCEYCKKNDNDILSYIDKKDLKKERRLARYCPECGRKLKRNNAVNNDYPRNRGV